MKQYLDLLEEISTSGVDRGDRTGTGTRAKFGHMIRHDISKSIPLLTTKRVFLRGVIEEVCWFLKGSTNVNYLKDKGVNIWNEWATESGEIGNMYGKQWVDWDDTRVVTKADWDTKRHLMEDGYELVAEDKGRGLVTIQRRINQIDQVLDDLKNRPESRRIIFTAWNPAELPSNHLSPQENVEAGKMALAPCHAFVQFFVADGKLSCLVFQRSVDSVCGLPFNLSGYAVLTYMIAEQCGLGVQDLVWVGGDTHIYHNHFDQVKEQLSRTPDELPKFRIKNKRESIYDYVYEDFEVVGYNPQAHIAAPIAV